jgi:hypothetical protein
MKHCGSSLLTPTDFASTPLQLTPFMLARSVPDSDLLAYTSNFDRTCFGEEA